MRPHLVRADTAHAPGGLIVFPASCPEYLECVDDVPATTSSDRRGGIQHGRADERGYRHPGTLGCLPDQASLARVHAGGDQRLLLAVL